MTKQLPEEENEEFQKITYTIGGMMVFPGNRIERFQTLNMARGFTQAISDRFDLTVECIRRHYVNQESPLTSTLSRYSAFFALFDDFREYVKFFLLDDIVTNGTEVKFFMQFDDFRPPYIPQHLSEYQEYRQRSIDFVEARNQRIEMLSL